MRIKIDETIDLSAIVDSKFDEPKLDQYTIEKFCKELQLNPDLLRAGQKVIDAKRNELERKRREQKWRQSILSIS